MGGPALFGNSGDKYNTTVNQTTNNTDSFNRTYSSTRAFSDVGNTIFNYNSPQNTGAAGAVANIGQYLIPGAFVLAGLYLLKRG